MSETRHLSSVGASAARAAVGRQSFLRMNCDREDTLVDKLTSSEAVLESASRPRIRMLRLGLASKIEDAIVICPVPGDQSTDRAIAQWHARPDAALARGSRWNGGPPLPPVWRVEGHDTPAQARQPICFSGAPRAPRSRGRWADGFCQSRMSTREAGRSMRSYGNSSRLVSPTQSSTRISMRCDTTRLGTASTGSGELRCGVGTDREGGKT